MKIIRAFPRKTNATPDDDLVRFGLPGLFDQCDEVHISVAFSYDKLRAERLAEKWKDVAPVKIGGPGYGTVGGEFEPGMYLKKGYVITSRGCPNKCWFCEVWKREVSIKELQIKDGFNVLDDNLLACSDNHIKKVFAMLKRQKQRAEFTGGFEASRLKSWHVDLLLDLKPAQMFFAYDIKSDYEPLVYASKMLCGFTRKHKRCYVLIGSQKDTIEKADKRLRAVFDLDFIPMAMLWRDKNGKTEKEWRDFQRLWARPILIKSRMKQ